MDINLVKNNPTSRLHQEKAPFFPLRIPLFGSGQFSIIWHIKSSFSRMNSPLRRRDSKSRVRVLIERLDKESISSDVISACLRAHWNLRGLSDEVNSLQRMKSEEGGGRGRRGRERIRADEEIWRRVSHWRICFDISLLRPMASHCDDRGLWIFAIASTNLDQYYLESAGGVISIADAPCRHCGRQLLSIPFPYIIGNILSLTELNKKIRSSKNLLN